MECIRITENVAHLKMGQTFKVQSWDGTACLIDTDQGRFRIQRGFYTMIPCPPEDQESLPTVGKQLADHIEEDEKHEEGTHDVLTDAQI